MPKFIFAKKGIKKASAKFSSGKAYSQTGSSMSAKKAKASRQKKEAAKSKKQTYYIAGAYAYGYSEGRKGKSKKSTRGWF